MNEKSGKQKLLSILLWVLSIFIIILYVAFENDPYDPLKGNTEFKDGTTVEYNFIRSKVIGKELILSLNSSKNVQGVIQYKRLASHDEWMEKDLAFDTINVGGHGKTVMEERLSVSLPSLDKMAGKYAYIITLKLDNETLVITDSRGNPIVTRYRGSVPAMVLIPHILFIILSMLFAVRAAAAVLSKESIPIRLMWMTIVTLLLGGFIFGPLMQKYAFGVYWSGVPAGWDLTDNKVVIELMLWIIAVYFNTGNRKGGKWSAKSIAIAGILTILIYLIPHSLLGSAYNYATSTGVGTGIQ